MPPSKSLPQGARLAVDLLRFGDAVARLFPQEEEEAATEGQDRIDLISMVSSSLGINLWYIQLP